MDGIAFADANVAYAFMAYVYDEVLKVDDVCLKMAFNKIRFIWYVIAIDVVGCLINNPLVNENLIGTNLNIEVSVVFYVENNAFIVMASNGRTNGNNFTYLRKI